MSLTALKWVASYLNSSSEDGHDDISRRNSKLAVSLFSSRVRTKADNKNNEDEQQGGQKLEDELENRFEDSCNSMTSSFRSSISTMVSTTTASSTRSSTCSLSSLSSIGSIGSEMQNKRDFSVYCNSGCSFNDNDNVSELDEKNDTSEQHVEHEDDHDDNNDCDDRSPVNILCIDGGGAKGCGIIPMYAALEDALSDIGKDMNDGTATDHDGREALANIFDMVAGTSAGGVAALLIHSNPEYGQVTKVGKEVFDRFLKQSLLPQASWTSILSKGHYYNDDRAALFKCAYGTNTPLCASSFPDPLPLPFSSPCPHNNAKGDVFNNGDEKVAKKKTVVRGPKAFVVATKKKRRRLFGRSRRRSMGKLHSALSNPMKLFLPPTLEACLLRTYEKPTSHSGIVPTQGISSMKMWEAAEATSSAPLLWPTKRYSVGSKTQECDGPPNGLHFADGGLVANNPTWHALQEAALLFPGRPLGLVISIGLGGYTKEEDIDTDGNNKDDVKEDSLCEELAETIEEAGGHFIRLNPRIDEKMGFLTTDPEILKQAEKDVIHYMNTSEEAKKAKELVRNCVIENPSIQGRYTRTTTRRQASSNTPTSSNHKKRRRF